MKQFEKIVEGQKAAESPVLRKKKQESFPDAVIRLIAMGWNVPPNDKNGGLSSELVIDGNGILWAPTSKEEE